MNQIRQLAGVGDKCTSSGKPIKDSVAFADEPRGFGVRVRANAKAGSLDGKSYLVQYTHQGIKRRVSIGDCASVELATAIKEAKTILGDVARGRDAFEERKAKSRDAYPLGRLIDDWEELYLRPQRRGHYADQAPKALRRIFKKYLTTGAAKLDRVTVVHVHDQVARQHPVMAARVIGYGSAAYGWAIDRGSLKDNPFVNIRVAPAKSRERVLTNEEIRAVWVATDDVGVYGDIVRLLLLTGQRREEVAGMRWGELSADGMTWTIPGARTKNGVAHIVPLSPQARDIIAAQPRRDAAELVFQGRSDNPNAFNGWGSCKRRLDHDSGVTDDWVLHDLRRTVATNLERLAVRLEVTEAVLNHVSGSRRGIIGVYQRHDWADEKRDALQRWGDRLEAIVTGQVAGNVVKLRSAQPSP
jgi:integrase